MEYNGRDPRQAWADYDDHVRRDHVQHYDGQIGSEATPAEFIAALVECTREWVRVLKPQGSLFVNLGDRYAGGNSGHRNADFNARWGNGSGKKAQERSQVGSAPVRGMPQKSLLGLPWRYAIACTDQLGLILRAEIIWAKPNGLPESVTDRVRRAHEQVFHLVKQPRYFAAVDEIREPHAEVSIKRAMPHRSPPGRRDAEVYNGQPSQTLALGQMNHPLGKLPGSVWSIPSAPLTVPAHLGVDHFAAFPPALVRPLVLGWSPAGICVECGEGRRPVAVAEQADAPSWALSQRQGRSWHGDGVDPRRALGVAAVDRQRRIEGYRCACPHPTAPTRPALCVDPFGGTGTTALVATVHGRNAITIDRSNDYCRLAAWRCNDPGERARALGVPKPPPVPDGMQALFDLDGEPA